MNVSIKLENKYKNLNIFLNNTYFEGCYKAMKNSKTSRAYLNISDEVTKLSVWQDISYLGRIKVPKSIIDKVLSISEYNLKSVSLKKLFFSMTKKIFNPYDGISCYGNDICSCQFDFYSKFLSEKNEFTPLDLCLGFITDKFTDLNHPIIDLYNQLSNKPIIKSEYVNKFSITISERTCSEWFTIIDREDLDDTTIVNTITPYLNSINVIEIDETDYVLLGFVKNVDELIYVFYNDIEYDVIRRKDINSRIHLLTNEEKEWLTNYKIESKPFSSFGFVVTKEFADFRFNLNSGVITKKNELGIWLETEKLYSDKEIELYIKALDKNLELIMSSNDFIKFLYLNDYINLDNAIISPYLLSTEFLKSATEKKQIKDSIELYEYKLNKLKDNNESETQIIRIEMLLDNLYNQTKNF